MSRSNPELWEKIVAEIKKSARAGAPGTWNARKAQLAVKEYKDRGGKYAGKKSARNSLVVWTKEDWGYITEPGGRYLPKSVREKLTPAEKRTENRRKKEATAAGKPRAAYSASVAAKLRRSRRSQRSRKSKR